MTRIGSGLILNDFLKNTLDTKKPIDGIQQQRLQIILADIIQLILEGKPIEPPTLKEFLINSLIVASEEAEKASAFYPAKEEKDSHWLRDLEIAINVKSLMDEGISYSKALEQVADENNLSSNSQVKRAYARYKKLLQPKL